MWVGKSPLWETHRRTADLSTITIKRWVSSARGFFREESPQGYSVILDYYGGTRINSDRTSSVPLAQYWKDYPKRLLEIEHQTGLSLLHPQIHFEYATESLGNAKASISDVMILADGVRIAIEAKFTEFANYGFQTIAGWLSESTGNRNN